jgi:hypothetical protein
MLYALVCYNSEKDVFSWTKEEDDAVMTKLATVHEKMAAKGKMGPSLRLGPTKTAATLRKNQNPPLITDGPYAETKEALLGFYVIDCDSQDEAIQFARDLAAVNPGGAYEIRPVTFFQSGSPVAV